MYSHSSILLILLYEGNLVKVIRYLVHYVMWTLDHVRGGLSAGSQSPCMQHPLILYNLKYNLDFVVLASWCPFSRMLLFVSLPSLIFYE